MGNMLGDSVEGYHNHLCCSNHPLKSWASWSRDILFCLHLPEFLTHRIMSIIKKVILQTWIIFFFFFSDLDS